MKFETLRFFTDSMEMLTVSRNVQWLKVCLEQAISSRALAVYADARYSRAIMFCPGAKNSSDLFSSIVDGSIDYDISLKVYVQSSRGLQASMEQWDRARFTPNHMVAYMYSPQASLQDSSGLNQFDYFFAPHPEYVHFNNPAISMADAKLAFRMEVDKWMMNHVRTLEGQQCIFDYRTGAHVFSAVSLERSAPSLMDAFKLSMTSIPERLEV